MDVSVRRGCLCAVEGCKVCLYVERCAGCVNVSMCGVLVWLFVLSKAASEGTQLSLAGDTQ